MMTSSCKLCGALPNDYDCAGPGYYCCPNKACEMSKVELSWSSWETLNTTVLSEEIEIAEHQEGVRYELEKFGPYTYEFQERWNEDEMCSIPHNAPWIYAEHGISKITVSDGCGNMVGIPLSEIVKDRIDKNKADSACGGEDLEAACLELMFLANDFEKFAAWLRLEISILRLEQQE